jgi:hypothetical protein
MVAIMLGNGIMVLLIPTPEIFFVFFSPTAELTLLATKSLA